MSYNLFDARPSPFGFDAVKARTDYERLNMCNNNYQQNLDYLTCLMNRVDVTEDLHDNDDSLHLGLTQIPNNVNATPLGVQGQESCHSWNVNITDVIRSEFERNGVDREIDEVDQIQLKLRSSSTAPVCTQELNNGNVRPSVLDDYVAARERKRRLSKSKRGVKASECVFCKNNGETAGIYSSHAVKDESGRVTCPILRKYTCPLCGVNGDAAHTLRYCPKNMEQTSRTLSLLRTSRLSTGRINPRAIRLM